MTWPPLETLKAFVTYGVAGLVVLGGGVSIVFIQMPADKLAIVASLATGAATFLYGQEIQTRTARQSQAATAAGHASSQTNGHTPGGAGPIDGVMPEM